MVSTLYEGGWEGEEVPSHRRYFSGGINDNFVVDVSDKDCRLVQHYTSKSVALYVSVGIIKRVSSYKDILGDGKYLEFSDNDQVTFPGQYGRTYVFYKDARAYQKNAEDLEIFPQKDKTISDWFKDQGLSDFD